MGIPTQFPTASKYACAVDGKLGTLEVPFDDFVEERPNTALCETIRPKIGARVGAEVITYPPDDCGWESCVRRCGYETTCMYALYDTTTRRCTKTIAAVLTDDESLKGVKWTSRAFRRKESKGGDLALPYYAGRCNGLSFGECLSDRMCEPNTGKMGRNDEKNGGSANWYCGRVSC